MEMKMRKKILFGSIIAITILIGVSFISVVGYKSVTSDVKESPLFNIRTNRAIGVENKKLDCKYANKGVTLFLPKRNDKDEMIQKVVDSIRIMNDKTFERYISSIITYTQNYGKLNGIHPNEIKEAFNIFRESNNPVPLNTNTKNITMRGGQKGLLGCTILIPFCFILASIIGLILAFILWCFPLVMTTIISCPTMFCPKTIKKLF
jgi:hypothetical protein